MAVIQLGPHWQVEVYRDMIDATPIEEQDPDWRYTDPAGHEHRYVHLPKQERLEVPTVDWHTTYTYWCEDCQEEHEDGEYRCYRCGAVVVPGMRAVTDRRYVAGLLHCHGHVERGANGFDELFQWWRDHADMPEDVLPRIDIRDWNDRDVALIGLRITEVSMVGDEVDVIHFVCDHVEVS